jgi:hypothetical protein
MLEVFETKVLRNLSRPKNEEVSRKFGLSRNDELRNLYMSHVIISEMKSRGSERRQEIRTEF